MCKDVYKIEFDVNRMKKALQLHHDNKEKLIKTLLDRIFRDDVKSVSVSGKGKGVKYAVPEEMQKAMLGKIEFYYFIFLYNIKTARITYI